jgi:hypothetical protein
MLECTCTVDRRDDTSLVELLVVNETSHPRRFRLANRLDGPVWPPRTCGLPADGWDDAGFEGVIEAEHRLALGFASPARPVDPPAEIVWDERESSREPSRESSADSITEPNAVVRLLADPRPPRDVVGLSDPTELDRTDAEPVEADSIDSMAEMVGSGADDVEARIERAEKIAQSTSLTAAARTLEELGGLEPVEALVEALRSDAAALRREKHDGALASRAEEAAQRVPLAAFRRLS